MRKTGSQDVERTIGAARLPPGGSARLPQWRVLASPGLLIASFGLGACSLTADAGAPPLAASSASALAAEPPPGPPEPVVVLGEAPAPETAPVDPSDDLTLGKRHFAEMNYGLAEQHFR